MVSGKSDEVQTKAAKQVDIAKQTNGSSSKRNNVAQQSMNSNSQLNNNIIKEEDNEHIEE